MSAEQDYQFKMREQAHNRDLRDLRKNFDEVNKDQIMAAKEREVMAKRHAKELEARRLEEVQNSIMLEQEMRKEKLRQFRSEVDAYNRIKDLKKEHERNMSDIEREADKKRIQDYIDNEIRRNQAYNEHYSNLTNNQIQMQNQYLNQLSPVLQKKYNDAVKQHHDAESYQRMMAQKEQNFQDHRKQFITNVYEHNKDRIQLSEQEIMKQKDNVRRENENIHQSMVSSSKKQLKEQDDYERRMKDDKTRRQLLYRETLDRQKETQEYQKKYYGNMSRREKEFNREDLRGYKQNVNDINCMIPGIRNIPSVGTRPLRGGDKFIKMQMDINSAARPQDPVQLGQPRDTMSVPERSSTVEPKRPVPLPPTSSQLIGWNYEHHKSRLRVSVGNSLDQPIQQTGLFNPITNPLPGIQQNPYLRGRVSGPTPQAVTPTMKRSNNAMVHAGAQMLQ